VLAGGQSHRLGQDKRRLRLWGEDQPCMLEHSVQVAAGLCPDVVVVLNDPQDWAALPARLVPDIYADGGALGGIYAGLLAAQHDYALAVACDMPFLNAALLRAMLARPRDYDVLVPRSPHPGSTRNMLGIESLHAIYSRACLGPMRAMLEGGRRQIAALIAQMRVAYVEVEEAQRYDPDGRSFVNINTAEQLAEAWRQTTDHRPPTTDQC
jgi:molybdopterin-guanine dinucleotide biosynthesis protein A